VLRGTGASLECLVLRRSTGGRCPGAWEVVHGHVEKGEGPAEAALREMREESGLVPLRFYNASRVEAFYQHGSDSVALVPVFVAFVADDAEPVLSDEHDAAEWLGTAAAQERVAWPREARALEDIQRLFRNGHPGPIDDVLLIET
jgi:dATP pyrophosphohydrolase